MAKLLILFVFGLVPGILSQCNVHRAQPLLKRSAYEFAVQLTIRIAQDKENHFAASTLSAWTLLATAALGADGTTLEELHKVLKLHKQRCFNDRFFELVKYAVEGGSNVTVERSSNIFVAEGLGIREEFRQRVQDVGVSEIETLPFDDLEATASTIGDFVSSATHNTIVDPVAPSDLDNVLLVMIDALYFKGSWRTPFPYENTEIETFYDDVGAQVGEVSMMRQVGEFNMSSINLINATVLELPFGVDSRYVMLVFLPYPKVTLSTVIDSLLSISLTTVYAIFAQDYVQTVSVEIPKFNIASDLDNLKELLSDMGLKAPFDSSTAQFPYLSDEMLYISNIIQKANVEVSEDGVEASAASAGFFSSRSRPEVFRANRPFFYMIVDTATQIPLFTGAYSKPSL